MSKAVMLSIQPKWCELIASGKKTIEVRKTRPKLETPFKCYIYETKAKDHYAVFHENTIGKVIGEFVCNQIDTYDDDTIHAFSYEDYSKWNDFDLYNSCVHPEDFERYANDNWLYGWHISDLVIYDKPKELTDFFVEGECYPPRCSKCKYFDKGNGYNVEDDCLLPYHLNEDGNDVKPLFKAPQSWCYVEKISGA